MPPKLSIFDKKEKKYIEQVFENGNFAGNGDFTKRVQTWLEEYFGAKNY